MAGVWGHDRVDALIALLEISLAPLKGVVEGHSRGRRAAQSLAIGEGAIGDLAESLAAGSVHQEVEESLRRTRGVGAFYEIGDGHGSAPNRPDIRHAAASYGLPLRASFRAHSRQRRMQRVRCGSASSAVGNSETV